MCMNNLQIEKVKGRLLKYLMDKYHVSASIVIKSWLQEEFPEHFYIEKNKKISLSKMELLQLSYFFS